MDDSNSLVFPEMACVRQVFPAAGISCAASAADAALKALSCPFARKINNRVAVAVGSRRIDRLMPVVDRCLRFLEQKGYHPFIVPAMGSHGGGTARGQVSVLAGYGITEASMGVPVAADMETRPLAALPGGPTLFMATSVLDADHLVVINRIKPHTKFTAAIESGICKMMTIGLGKKDGAAEFHRHAVDQGFGIIEQGARVLLQKLNLLFAVGLVEDNCGCLAKIAALPPDGLVDREKQLLKQARQMMGRIPFDRLDILIIDQFGKDISGIGMDSNVTGRHRDITGDMNTAPHVRRIFVRDLSPGSDGNANGIGLADVTTRRLVERMDLNKTRVNAITAISPEKAAIPVYFDTDRECLWACARTTGVPDPENLRVVRIKHTASLEYMQISRPLAAQLRQQPQLSLVSEWAPLAFDAAGNLRPVFNVSGRSG